MAEGLTATPLRVLFGAASVGFVWGFGGGVLGTKKFFQTKYDKLAQEEIDQARDYYQKAKLATEARLKAPIEEVVEYLGYVRGDDTVMLVDGGTPEEVKTKEDITGVLKDDAPVAYHQVTRGPSMVPPPPANIFTDSMPSDHVWDYAQETKHRASNPGIPYVIHLDEFGERKEDGYTTVTYTFYMGDELLSDERDELIDNVDELVGRHNLERFGHGSDNMNIVMVRNEALELDIEIAKSEGNFNPDVEGFLKHHYSVEKMPKRERFDDDQ